MAHWREKAHGVAHSVVVEWYGIIFEGKPVGRIGKRKYCFEINFSLACFFPFLKGENEITGR